MDWDDVRVFLAVARAGRVSGAARRLGVEHSTVVRRIAALEADLGAPLFYRTSSGYNLAPHGEAALADAEAMEERALAIGARTREQAGAAPGRVRVAMLDEYATHWLAPRLPAFHAGHPAIQLEIVVGILQLDLSRGEAELAIRTPRPRQTGLAAVKLAPAVVGLYASRRMLGRRRLVVDGASRGLTLLVYSRPHHMLQSAAWFQPVLAGSTIALATNSTGALLAAARAGAGIAVLPRFVGAQAGDLVPVSADVSSHDMWLVTHPEFRRDPRVRIAADFLRRNAGGLR